MGYINGQADKHVLRAYRQCELCSISPDGSSILSGSGDKTLALLDVSSGKK